MKGFKEYINEDVKGTYEVNTYPLNVYVNPTIQELKEVGNMEKGLGKGQLRGYIDNEGNLYVWEARFIHTWVLRELQKDVKDLQGNDIYDVTMTPAQDYAGVSVHIIKFNEVYLGESMEFFYPDKVTDEFREENIEYVEKLFKKAKKKNRILKFIPKKIDSRLAR